MRYIITIFMVVMMLGMVSGASDTYQKNVDVDWHVPCLDDNNDPCSSNTQLLFTLTAPNGTVIYKNSSMTSNGTTFNHTLETSDHGIYSRFITAPGSNTTHESSYEVTVTGKGLSTSQGIIYLAILALTVLLFFFSIVGAVKIPWRNNRSPDGYIVSINSYKYLKVGLFCFSYLLMIWMSFIIWNISDAFLGIAAMAGIFRVVFYSLTGALFPLLVVFSWVMVISVVKDSKIRKELERGVFSR